LWKVRNLRKRDAAKDIGLHVEAICAD